MVNVCESWASIGNLEVAWRRRPVTNEQWLGRISTASRAAFPRNPPHSTSSLVCTLADWHGHAKHRRHYLIRRPTHNTLPYQCLAPRRHSLSYICLTSLILHHTPQPRQRPSASLQDGLRNIAGPGHEEAAAGKVYTTGGERGPELDRRGTGREAAARGPAGGVERWDRSMQVWKHCMILSLPSLASYANYFNCL
jgi:hypothetical protein